MAKVTVMASSDEPIRNERKPAGIGPGERLQAARIQQGLSLDDVAGRMHLSANILEAIEENDFEEITAPIFVKGYLRAYARIVDLDEDDMIQQYVDFYSEEDPPITSTSNMAPELSVTDARIKWTTYLVILILAALLAAWWWNKQQNQEVPISLDSQSQVAEPDEPSNADVVGSEIEAVSEIEPQAASVEPVTQSRVESPEPEPAQEESVAMSEPAETSPLQSEPLQTEPVESGASENPDPLAATDSAEPVSPASGGSIIQIAPSGTDKLSIVVHADTWADIKDSSGFQMVYDLLRADQTLELVGDAPFSVFLGNGHGVEILINGEEIDFASRVRDDNTTRLKVGG